MNINLLKFKDVHLTGACINPAAGERLSEYLADPLESPAAKDVEAHLLDCRHCREFFLTVFSLRDAARTAQQTQEDAGGGDARSEQDANVLAMAHFRKS